MLNDNVQLDHHTVCVARDADAVTPEDPSHP